MSYDLKNDFKLSDCLVRPARFEDKDGLLKVARGIWGGSDYLPQVLDRWLSEPWFLVCEYKGDAIACLKMTLFPDNVLWFEGLRVQARYQNLGIATKMNKHCFELAKQISEEHPGIRYEFCTYYKNVESLHLTQKLGFKTVERFYVLDKRGIKETREPEVLPDFGLKHFHNYPHYIPCAWQSLHHTEAVLPYLREHGKLFRTPNSVYYLGGLHEQDIIILEPNLNALQKDLPYLQYWFGSRKSYSVIMPEKFKSLLFRMLNMGFRFWEEQPAENMLVLKL
jgi:hypothetical protein